MRRAVYTQAQVMSIMIKKEIQQLTEIQD